MNKRVAEQALSRIATSLGRPDSGFFSLFADIDADRSLTMDPLRYSMGHKGSLTALLDQAGVCPETELTVLVTPINSPNLDGFTIPKHLLESLLLEIWYVGDPIAIIEAREAGVVLTVNEVGTFSMAKLCKHE